MYSPRWMCAVAIVGIAATLGLSRQSLAASILLTIDGSKDCPEGLTIKAKATQSGMIDLDVLMDANKVAHTGDLYKDRVGAVAYLKIATPEAQVASVSVHGEKEGKLTRYRFRLSQHALMASELDLSLNLFEKDGTATVGGGVSMQIHLVGFQPLEPAPAAK